MLKFLSNNEGKIFILNGNILSEMINDYVDLSDYSYTIENDTLTITKYNGLDEDIDLEIVKG